MSETYTVKPGDTLTSIAAKHGFEKWQDIYFHPDNADFRRRRPDPNLIFPGDLLILPDLEPDPPPPDPSPPDPVPPDPAPPDPVPPEPDDDRPPDGLYSAFWLFPVPREPIAFVAARRNLNTVDLQPGVKAALLFPALFTPAVVADRDDVELLVLLHESEPTLFVEDVNRQLKFGPSLAVADAKSFDPGLLFDDPQPGQIRVVELTFDDDVLETPSKRFRGIVDERPLLTFRNTGFTRLFAVTLAVDCLKQAQTASRQVGFERGDQFVLKGGTENDKLVDRVIHAFNSEQLPERGKFTFEVTDDVHPGKSVLGDSVQAYHPVFYRRELQFANFAHVSDIHVNARANVLSATNARVIDDEEGKAPDSPELGGMLNVASRNIKQILDRIGQPSSFADALLIGGDLMDFRLNVWPEVPTETAGDVWRRVALDKSFGERYHNFVDYVSLFSLVIDFTRRSGKPIFGITGNHDSYGQPYGLSPRVTIPQTGILVRLNAGLPADHNLTIYEAFLAFGETADVVKSFTMFEPVLASWFYGVFTPFKDHCVQWPKQAVVSLGWGAEEDIFDAPLTNHGFGHLPRSDEAITDKQLDLLDSAIASGKKVLMSMHFTVVSYREARSRPTASRCTSSVWASVGRCSA